MKSHRRHWAVLIIATAFAVLSGAPFAEEAEVDPCASSRKGTSQTPAGMCIDGVLFKDVLQRLAVLEAQLSSVSATSPQGKQQH
jgi:hypothetical protein